MVSQRLKNWALEAVVTVGAAAICALPFWALDTAIDRSCPRYDWMDDPSVQGCYQPLGPATIFSVPDLNRNAEEAPAYSAD
jgi:hypothetical protein